MSVNVDLKNFLGFYDNDKILDMEKNIIASHKKLYDGTGCGSDFLGWVDLPNNYDKDEFNRIKKASDKIKNDSDVLLVIGIGGSYLGARAAIELLKSPNYNLIDRKGSPQIFFIGNNISAEHISEIITLIGERDFSVNVISKSGMTTEPALAFHFIEDIMKKRYGSKWTDRLYITTDKSKGTLRPFVEKYNVESFIIPDNVGGRFSVLTAVGLLPIACAGINIDDIMSGASLMSKRLKVIDDNPGIKYAMARNLAYNDGKVVEILGSYEPKFRFMAEWWKQLFGESEGKDGKGIFPASQDLTADLHSLGQFIQDGNRILFETIVNIENPGIDIKVENIDDNFSNLALFEGKTLDFINKKAHEGTTIAHVSGGVPNITINIDSITDKSYGELIYFFEYVCGISAYTLDVNPFDQPGVEAYKKEMMNLIK